MDFTVLFVGLLIGVGITEMDADVKAVEYFIRTGKLYPGIDWSYSS